LNEIPVIIRDISDSSAMAIALVENIQRKDLNPIEEATAIGRLIKEFSLTHEQVAKSIGKSRTAVTNLLRLLNLTDEVKEMLNQTALEMGHARALLALESMDQVRIAQLIIKRQLSVRESEKLIRAVLNGEKEKTLLPNDFLEKAKHWEKRLNGKISLPLQIHVDPKGKGRLVIHFDSFNATNPFLKYIENYEDGSIVE
jgi:ParB family chromosome partitioning protein